jgi:hypothetical protein
MPAAMIRRDGVLRLTPFSITASARTIKLS